MLITQAEWARRHGFSRQYVSRLVKQGIVRLSNGQIDPAKEEVAAAAFNKARIARDALLSIADRLAPILAAQSDAAAIHAALSSEIRTALQELTGGPETGQ